MILQLEVHSAIVIQNDLGSFSTADAFVIIGVGTGSCLLGSIHGRLILSGSFLHVLVVAVCAIPVSHQLFLGQDFFIGICANVRRCVEADQCVGAAVDLTVNGEIQADGVGISLAVVLTGLTEHDTVAQVSQSCRCVTAAKLASTTEAAVSTGTLSNGANQVLILITHNAAGEESVLIGIGIGIGNVSRTRSGCQRVVSDEHTDTGMLGQNAGNNAAVVGHGHLGAAFLVTGNTGSNHLTVNGVLHLIGFVYDFAHQVHILTVLVLEVGLQDHSFALAAGDGIFAQGRAQEVNFPVTVGIHIAFDPGFGNGSNIHTDHELIVGANSIVCVLADSAGTAGNDDLDALLTGLDQAVFQGGDLTGKNDQHLSIQQDEVFHLGALGCGRIVSRDNLDIVAQRFEHLD